MEANLIYSAIRSAALTAVALCACTTVLAATPHDPYTYWLPSGSIDSSKSEFTVELRATRMGIPDADLVLVRPASDLTPLIVTVEGRTRPEKWDGASFVIPSDLFTDKKQVSIRLSGEVPSCRFYLTRDFREIPVDRRGEYDRALELRFAQQWRAAEVAFRKLALADISGDLGRLCRMHARYCSYRQKSAQPGLSAEARYLLGLYCMENGFWEGAADEFKKATELAPADADAWYMLADARAYRDGDSDEKVEPLIPIYRRSAELRDVDPNVWNIYVGIFRNMWVEADDGKGGKTRKLMVMSDENVRRIQKEWRWMSDTLWAASRGNLKLNNTFRVFDDEYDNTDPHAFDQLWGPGEQDVFMKFFEGGPAEALGHDCGPNRTAVVDIGTWCGWEVYLHEWNHTLDWSMLTSENGKGVPVTHSSDWCGFQPIPCMGRGHASCNHYYMTPGMFQTVQGSEPERPGFNDAWLVTGPYPCETNKGLETPFAPERQSDLPKAVKVDGVNGWVDLRSALRPSQESVVAYARAYVYSPTKQKVRMWLGMNDGIRVWVNDHLAYGGIYKAIVRFDEANEPDQVVPSVVLEPGWNSVLVKVENLPKTPEQLAALGVANNGWGFSLRLCDMRNSVLPGVKWALEVPAGWTPRPAFPPVSERVHYRWSEVADDYTTLLPQLTEEDLEQWTGLPDISITRDCLVAVPGARQREWTDRYSDTDRILNNLLNWRFESMAVLRYQANGGEQRDLVFLRPEAFETYMKLMKLPADSGITSHADCVIGYVLVGGLDDHPNGRLMLVLDTCLGAQLPVDEKDLLDISSL